MVIAYTAYWVLGQRILINLNGTLDVRFPLKSDADRLLWLDSVTEKREAATFPTKTVTVVIGDTTAEALSREVSARLRAARHETGATTRSYRQRLEGTVQSSSGGYLDSFITLDIKPQGPSTGGIDEGTPNEEPANPTRNEDPLGKMVDCEIGRKPAEGPLMTTRRF